MTIGERRINLDSDNQQSPSPELSFTHTRSCDDLHTHGGDRRKDAISTNHLYNDGATNSNSAPADLSVLSSKRVNTITES